LLRPRKDGVNPDDNFRPNNKIRDLEALSDILLLNEVTIGWTCNMIEKIKRSAQRFSRQITWIHPVGRLAKKWEASTVIADLHSLMEPGPSLEATNCAATQELPSSLWNPRVHHRLHKFPPLVPILSQINPIHTIPSYLSKINFNIVYPPTSLSSQWSLSFWLSHHYPICIPLPPIRAKCPAHVILLDLFILIRIIGDLREINCEIGIK
jgi:hypothetical protein